jgi:hypothetical protein
MAEGLLRGTAEAEMTVRRYTEDREECVKDDAGKCTPEKRKFKVRCQARRFELSVMMRLTGPDDALIWSDDRPEVYEDRGCEDASNAPRTGNSVVSSSSTRAISRRAMAWPGSASATTPAARWRRKRGAERPQGIRRDERYRRRRDGLRRSLSNTSASKPTR